MKEIKGQKQISLLRLLAFNLLCFLHRNPIFQLTMSKTPSTMDTKCTSTIYIKALFYARLFYAFFL